MIAFDRTKNLGRCARKGAIPWNKGKRGDCSEQTLRRMSLGQKRRFRIGSPWNKGLKTGISAWRGKRRADMWNEQHPNWKGTKVGYRALHRWIESHRGKPSLCAYCGTTTSKRFHWANKSGRYVRDFGDFLRLCVSCHWKYDKGGKQP